MRARKLVIERLVTRLKEVKRDSTMKTANFVPFLTEKTTYPKTGEEIDRLIKERTELWRRSWLTDPLTEIIKDLEYEMNR